APDSGLLWRGHRAICCGAGDSAWWLRCVPASGRLRREKLEELWCQVTWAWARARLCGRRTFTLTCTGMMEVRYSLVTAQSGITPGSTPNTTATSEYISNVIAMTNMMLSHQPARTICGIVT